jgi:hypothetical protein
VDPRHPARHKSDVALHLVPTTGSQAAESDHRPAVSLFRRYPVWRVIALDVFTVAHFALGCAAILIAWRWQPIVAWPVGLAYLVFATVQSFVLMPLVVCPGCVYRAVSGGRCPTGLNLLSARLCPPVTDTAEFRRRTCGPLCQTSLSLCSWVFPLPVALAGVALHLSWPAAVLTAALVASLPLRVVIGRAAVCPRCLSRRWCPAARVVRAA